MEELFNNRYRKELLIGRGAFSEVWKVTDVLTGVTQALKIYSPSAAMDDDGIEMMIHEFALMANVNHQNLLHPLSFDICDSRPYLVLPFCKNGNINKRIGKFSEKEAWELLRDASNALAYLHALEPPIIHQDIKPANILISDIGSYMLTDFGVSTKAKSTLSRISTEDKSRLSAGTLSYMAPEKFSSNNLPIMANDIFSLGSTVYEMLTGYLPFGNEGGLLQKMGADIPELQGDYSADLKAVLKECLAKEPWDRPSAKDLAKFATNILEGKPNAFRTEDLIPHPLQTTPQAMSEPVIEPELAIEPTPIIEPAPILEPVIEPQPTPVPEPVIEREPTPEPVIEQEPVLNDYTDKGNNGKRFFFMAAIFVVLLCAGVSAWWLLGKNSSVDKPALEKETPSVSTGLDSITAEPAVDYSAESADAVLANQNEKQTNTDTEVKNEREERKDESGSVTANVVEEKFAATSQNNRDKSKENSDNDLPEKRQKTHGGSLSYGSWTGSVSDGKPVGIGTLTVSSPHVILCNNGSRLNTEPGDKITNAEFNDNGILYQGTWVKSNGESKTILP